MVKILYDKDASLDFLKGKRVAVIGYGAQGRAQALCMHDSGVDVVVGLREDGKSWQQAEADGLKVASMKDAAAQSDIIHILIPDEYHKEVYDGDIKNELKPGKVLSFSHGFNICFKRIIPPSNVDVVMIAPKAPGTEERKIFLEGFGVPGLVAVKQNHSGKAREIALAMAKSIGLTRAGVLECTFEQETYEDLFGEQAVLCGGVSELMKAGFEVLVEKGYPPEMAYFECLHEMKLIIDLVQKGGLAHMWEVVSNTAEYGGLTRGKRIITPEVKENMRKMLKEVEDGTFAKEFVAEYENGMQNLKRLRQEESKHPIEVIGKEIRALFKQK